MRRDEVIEWYSAMLNKERERSAELAGALGGMACVVEKAVDYVADYDWKQRLLEDENRILRSVNHEREKDSSFKQDS